MSTHVTHPFGAEQSKADKLIERVGNASWRLAFLGFLTFLQHLRWISDAFEIMQIFSLFFIFLFVPPLLGIFQYIYNYVASSDSDEKSDDPLAG
jgi:apolipoprotein N-acyltransferase